MPRARATSRRKKVHKRKLNHDGRPGYKGKKARTGCKAKLPTRVVRPGTSRPRATRCESRPPPEATVPAASTTSACPCPRPSRNPKFQRPQKRPKAPDAKRPRPAPCSAEQKSEEQNKEDVENLQIPELKKKYWIVGHGEAYVPGTFGDVYKARRLQVEGEDSSEASSNFVAIKRLHCVNSVRQLSEIKILSQLGRKAYIACVQRAYRTSTQLIFVMPFIDHVKFELYYWQMDEKMIRDYMGALMSSLAVLAQHGWVHRDVKPGNMLHRPGNWNGDGQPARFCLCDFGLAQRKDELQNKCIQWETQMISIDKKGLRRNSVSIKPWEAPSRRRGASQRIQHRLTTARKPKRVELAGTQSILDKLAAFRSKNGEEAKAAAAAARTPRQPARPGDGAARSGWRPSRPNFASEKKPTPDARHQEGGSRVRSKLEPEMAPELDFNTDWKKLPWVSALEHTKRPMLDEALIPERVPKAERSGTRGFRAPEILLRSYHQTDKVDVYSAGIILLCLLTRLYPFFEASNDEVALMEITHIVGYRNIQIAANKINRYFKVGGDRSHLQGRGGFVKLAKLILEKHVYCPPFFSRDPPLGDQLPTWMEEQPEGACVHANTLWTDEAWDLLEVLTEVDQFKRPTALEALSHPFFKNCNTIRLE